jgi:copper resistance protein C
MTNVRLKVAALLFMTTMSATAVQAHATLDHASPQVGSTVGSSPEQVTLYFTDNLESKFSGAEVRNSAGVRADLGSRASGNSLRVSVKGLSAGAYTVSWHVLSADTHKTQGSFNFRVGN